MSAIPLSIAERDGLLQTTSGRDSDGPSPDDYQAEQRAAESARLDGVIDGAVSNIAEREREAEANREAGRGRSLDEIIARNMERAEAKTADERAFLASRETRDTLNERYRGHNPTTAKSLDMFLGWIAQFRANPAQTADQFAQAYLSRSPYGLPDRKDANAKAEHHNKLDQVIADSIDRAGSEKTDFEATKAQRAALKQVFPHLSFDEALSKIAKIDRDMHIDPLGTAMTVGAMFGAAITPGQRAAAQVAAQAQQAIAFGNQAIPALRHEGVRVTTAHVLQSGYLQESGNMGTDLARAADVAQRILHNGHAEHFALVTSPAFNQYRTGNLGQDLMTAGQLLQQQHAQIQADAPRQIADFARKHHDLPEYKTNMAVLLASGHAHDLPTAYRMAKAERQSQQAAVSRARRAAPVHSSVGVGNAYGPRGLDAILGQAIERSGMS